MRLVLIDYLTEKAVSTDYSTLAVTASHLAKHFWLDLQTHHPGIATLHLNPQQTAAWQARLALLPDGR